jgi:succinate dehydrogenase / fumarate reductase, membrane anchor subunit
MRYLTDRKRAEGKGASHTGTAHHWSMQVSSVGLAFLVPIWVYVFGSTLGKSHAKPFPAVLTALVIFVGMRHFAKGASMMIEDYAKGTARKMLIIFVTSLSYVITATGLFALVKIAI